MKILFLTTRLFPRDAGDALHSDGFLRALSRFNEVFVVTFGNGDAGDEQEAETLRRETGLAGLKVIAPHQIRHPLLKLLKILASNAMISRHDHPLYRNAVRTFLDQEAVDCVIFDHLRSTVFWPVVLNHPRRPARMVLNQHNIEWLNVITMGLYHTNPLLRLPYYLEAQRVKRYEKKMVHAADAVLAISPSDCDHFRHCLGRKGHLYLNKPLIEFPRVKTAGDLTIFRKRILFVGSLFWAPNVIGVRWFIEEVFAPLIKKDPEFHLFLVGSRPAKSVLKLVSRFADHITVTGWVPETKEYYHRCDVAVIPLHTGTGAKIKVLESLASGIPTLVTPHCAKDYPFRDEMLVCDTGKEFLDAINRVASDPLLRRRLSEKSVAAYKAYMTLSEELRQYFSSVPDESGGRGEGGT